MSYEDIVVSKDDGVGIIRLNRPKVSERAEQDG